MATRRIPLQAKPWPSASPDREGDGCKFAGLPRPRTQDAAGVEVGGTAFGGWVPSDLRRFLPLAVLRTCWAEMVFLPTRFFFASAISILLSEGAEDTGDMDPQLNHRAGETRPIGCGLPGIGGHGRPARAFTSHVPGLSGRKIVP